MSSGEAWKHMGEYMQLVQSLIKQCLQLYMSQKEVMDTLVDQKNIKPEFIEHAWKKLEEEDQEFFKAYNLRLIVKDQINQFNKLLDRQVELRHQMCPAGVASMPMSNGSHIPPLHHNSTCFPLENIGFAPRTEIYQPMPSSSLCTFPNGGSSFNNVGSGSPPLCGTFQDTENPSFGCLGQLTRNFSPSDLTAEFQNISDILIYSRSPFLVSHSDFLLDPCGRGEQLVHNNSTCFSLENIGSAPRTESIRQPIGSSSLRTFPNGGSSFNNGGSASPPLNEIFRDTENPSFGCPGQITPSDLTSEFHNSSDILIYSRSPFLASDADFSLDPYGRGEQQ